MDLVKLEVVLARERWRLLGVERDQRHEIGAAVAQDDGLGDPAVVTQRVLEVRGRDVLAPGGDDDVLRAAGDEQKAVLVQTFEVAGVQPTVHQRPERRLHIPVVALENVGAFDQDAAIVRDADLDPWERPAESS